VKTRRAGLALALSAALAFSTASLLPADAAPAAHRAAKAKPHKKKPSEPRPATPGDALTNPLADKQAELRQNAIADVLSGEKAARSIAAGSVVKMGKKPSADGSGKVDQYVQLDNEGVDRVFTLLVQFGNQRHPDFPDQDTLPDVPGPSRFDGPLFNQIPKPGPNDNSTPWQPNYNKSYYNKLYFGTGANTESLKTYYEKQSSGRYSISGEVTDFVKVPYNEARYGRPFEGELDGVSCSLDDIVCSNTWALIGDAMTKWVADQKANGRTDAQIAATLATYDKQDRYDYDGDGNFDEPDGYMDRFQIVHAGGDEADGDPIQGEDAIWSHRWYSHYPDEGITGPSFNKLGGTQIPGTNFWVGDYTIGPENGGLSTIAHEYGHDLGLPDHYDTAAGGDNPVSWWTLMAQSRLSAPGDQGIGTRPGDLGVWDKLQLGWLDYEVVVAGQKEKIQLGPHEYNSKKAQGVAVVLPDKQVATQLTPPAAGAKQWWSGQGNDYDAVMSRSDIAVPAAGGTLSMKLAYNIEEDFDYAYVEVQSPAGSGTWAALPTTSIDPDTGADADDVGIDGASPAYQQATWDLAPYAGKTIGLRVRYSTDGAAQGADPSLGWSGILVDDIKVTSGSTTVFSDGAETTPNGWALAGFSSVAGSFTTAYDQFYLASNRSYVSYDKYLQSGPYNFGFPDRPDFVEHFPYQDGLLVNYWDTSYSDNNTSVHPGGGLVLPIDSHPKVIYNLEGNPWRGRIQNYDDPFSLQKADSFTLHVNGKASYIRGAAANPLFDDSNPNRYFTPFVDGGLPRVGVKVAGAGVQIEVLKQNGTSMTIKVY
jgi:immune inhibitor A